MKRTKRILAALLTVALIVSISVIPVSAAGYPWTSMFSQFQVLRLGCEDRHAGFTIPLQTFLESYSTDWNDRIEEAGGRDGWYGEETALCLGEYQSLRHLSSDKVCGARTWSTIAGDMDDDSYSLVTIFSYDGCYIINATNDFPVEFCYYYYYGGNTFLSSPFYTTSSYV